MKAIIFFKTMHHDYATSSLGKRLIDVGLGNGTGTNWTPVVTTLHAVFNKKFILNK